MSLFLDIHNLQTVPPSCVNRDDTGSPKTAVYGGSIRARVSSQAWKHAIREDFKRLFSKEELANRTKNVVEMVEDEMYKIDDTLSAEGRHKKAVKALEIAGLKLKSDKKNPAEKAAALFFFSHKQAEALAKHTVELDLNDKKVKDILSTDIKENPSVDIALFGRMVANDSSMNYDAAAQVAHAISTHAVQNEYDYFTAVDDMQEDNESGAGHLGTVEFNSSTLYRYANVNITELAKAIGTENTAEAVRKFVQAFVCSMPTGRMNSFANRTFPDMVYITLRDDQPVNLCGAFEKPVRKTENGYAEESEKCLTEYAKKVYSRYATEPIAAYCIGDMISEIAEALSFNELLDKLEKTVNDKLNEG